MPRRTPRSSFLFPLRDGTPVRLRALRPSDRERLRRGIRLLSPESLYLRFFTSAPHLSDEALRYLTEVDQVNHVAWGAVDPDANALPGLGVGRFVRLDDEPEAAEWAIAVIDQYQQRGLGTVLAGLLYLLAGERDILHLRAFILPQNQVLVRRLRALGARTAFHSGLVQVNLPVHRDLAQLPETPQAQLFRDLLEHLQEARYH